MFNMLNIFVEVFNMSDILVKKQDAAKSLGIAETTVQSYAQQIEKLGYKFERDIKNSYLFSGQDMGILKTIVRLRKNKVSLSESVKMALSDMVDMSNITDMSSTTDVTDISVIGNMSKNMSDMSKVIADMSDKFNEVVSQNKALVNQVESLKIEQLRESMETKKLINEVKDMLIAQQQAAATKEEEPQKKKGFWARLLGE